MQLVFIGSAEGIGITNPGFEYLQDWKSEVQQNAAFDAKTVIDFEIGPATDPDGILQYDGSGVFTVLKGGPLWIKNRFRLSRVGQAGVSEVFLMAEISTDGGNNWFKIEQAEVIDVKLEDSNAVDIFFDLSPFTVVPGVKLRQVMSRSSDGTNDGSLIPGVPSAAQQAIGFEIAPSAYTVAYKAIEFTYV